MSNTRDTLKLYKQACISYAPSDVVYREHTVSRATMVGLRRELMDRVVGAMEESELFMKESTFPRRYFDDLVLDSQL